MSLEDLGSKIPEENRSAAVILTASFNLEPFNRKLPLVRVFTDRVLINDTIQYYIIQTKIRSITLHLQWYIARRFGLGSGVLATSFGTIGVFLFYQI